MTAFFVNETFLSWFRFLFEVVFLYFTQGRIMLIMAFPEFVQTSFALEI